MWINYMNILHISIKIAGHLAVLWWPLCQLWTCQLLEVQRLTKPGNAMSPEKRMGWWWTNAVKGWGVSKKKLVDFTSSKKIRKLVSETDCDRLASGLSGRLKPYPSFVILVLSKNQLQFSIYLFMRPPSIPTMSTPAAIGPKQLRAIK